MARKQGDAGEKVHFYYPGPSIDVKDKSKKTVAGIFRKTDKGEMSLRLGVAKCYPGSRGEDGWRHKFTLLDELLKNGVIALPTFEEYLPQMPRPADQFTKKGGRKIASERAANKPTSIILVPSSLEEKDYPRFFKEEVEKRYSVAERKASRKSKKTTAVVAG